MEAGLVIHQVVEKNQSISVAFVDPRNLAFGGRRTPIRPFRFLLAQMSTRVLDYQMIFT